MLTTVLQFICPHIIKLNKMRRSPYPEHPNQSATRYITQKRTQHERKPTFDFVLPPSEHEKPAFRISHLLNESKIYRRSSPFNRRPITSGLKGAQSKRNDGALSKNSRSSNPERDFEDSAKLDLSVDNKIGSSSSPNSRYKGSLTDRKEQKYDLIVSSIKQRTKVYNGVSFKQPERFLSQIRREVPPQFQRLLPRTPRGYSNPRASRGLSNAPEMEVKRQQPSPRHSFIKSRLSADEGSDFEYTLRFSYRTKKGHTPSNPNKPNQDSHVICPNIQNKTWQHYFGVNDGHGVFGHLVSSHMKANLIKLLPSTHLPTSNPKQSLMKIYRKVFLQLCESNIDVTFSGSTMVGCFMQNQKLYCCNVGDSRAILGSRDGSGRWEATALSRDHKPSIIPEAERILKAGGRVQAFKDSDGKEIGPLRVWIKEEQVPGLAMTRSFGDLVAASVGVSSQPQITEFTLTNKDKIVVIASDGVWQFLENDYIITKLGYFYETNKLQEACDWLLEAAHSSWTQQCSVIDDITLIVLFIAYD